ncbi:MAG: hypothetical protein ABR585_08195, partial [Gemmatimonadaceae bacterium]
MNLPSVLHYDALRTSGELPSPVHSANVLRLTGLLSGVVALAAAIAGVGSWILFGACFVAWCYSGWLINFS